MSCCCFNNDIQEAIKDEFHITIKLQNIYRHLEDVYVALFTLCTAILICV